MIVHWSSGLAPFYLSCSGAIVYSNGFPSVQSLQKEHSRLTAESGLVRVKSDSLGQSMALQEAELT